MFIRFLLMVGNRNSWDIRPRPLRRLWEQHPHAAGAGRLPDINEVDVDAHVEARSNEPEGAGPFLLLVKGFAQRSKGRFLNISVKARQLTQFSSDSPAAPSALKR